MTKKWNKTLFNSFCCCCCCHFYHSLFPFLKHLSNIFIFFKLNEPKTRPTLSIVIFGCCCYLVMTNSHSFQQPKIKNKNWTRQTKQNRTKKKHLKNSFEVCDEEKGVCDGWEKNTNWEKNYSTQVPLVFHANHHCVKKLMFLFI